MKAYESMIFDGRNLLWTPRAQSCKMAQTVDSNYKRSYPACKHVSSKHMKVLSPSMGKYMAVGFRNKNRANWIVLRKREFISFPDVRELILFEKTSVFKIQEELKILTHDKVIPDF